MTIFNVRAMGLAVRVHAKAPLHGIVTASQVSAAARQISSARLFLNMASVHEAPVRKSHLFI